MRNNIGTIDLAVRVVIGLVLLALAFAGPQTPWGFIGFVPLLTALIGFCPLYRILGLSTCGRRGGGTPAGV